MPQAARLGDPIGHAGPKSTPATVALAGAAVSLEGAAASGGEASGKITGPCSGNVFTNGIPAARAQIDLALCSRHPSAPLAIVTGSSTVFINGMPAARVSDKIACGAFIADGSGNVFIGDGSVPSDPVTKDVVAAMAEVQPAKAGKSRLDFPVDGIMRDDIVDKYLEAMKDKVFKTWDKDTVAERIANTQSVLDALTADAKLPKLKVVTDADFPQKDKLTIQRGEFDADKWTMVLRADIFSQRSISTADRAALTETLFHETRHSEQSYNVLRYVEPNSWRFPRVHGTVQVVNMARANPLSSSSPIGIEAKKYYESQYGTGSARRNEIMEKLKETGDTHRQAVAQYGANSSQARAASFAASSWYDAYRELPEEADAFNAGAKVKDKWKR